MPVGREGSDPVPGPHHRYLQARAWAVHSKASVFHPQVSLTLLILTLSPPQALAWFFMAACAMKDAKFCMTPVPHPPALMHWAAVALPILAKLNTPAKAIGTNLFILTSVLAVI